MLRHGEVAAVFDLVDDGLGYVALPKEEQGGGGLAGDAPGKALLHLVAGGEGMVCPGYLGHAAGAEVALVAHEGFPTVTAETVTAEVGIEELQEVVQRVEAQGWPGGQGMKRQLSP